MKANIMLQGFRSVLTLTLLVLGLISLNTQAATPFLAPYETSDAEIFFKDFDGDGNADLAIRRITGGANGDVDIYFYNTNSPPASSEVPINGDFETGDLSGWTATGSAFSSNPTDNNEGAWGLEWSGSWYLNSRKEGETATGTVISASFELTSQYVDFLISGWSKWGGGGFEYNYVSLHLASDDTELDRAYTPNQTDALRNAFLDGGTSNIGEQVYIKVTDDCLVQGYSWIAVDQFRLAGNVHRSFNANPDIKAAGVTVNNTTDWGLFFADINGDDKADLINHNRVNGNVYVHYNSGSGFSATPDKTYSALAPTGDEHRIFFADINGDGFDDYCVLNEQTGYFEAFRNISATMESSAYIQQTIGTPSYPFNGNETLLADLDGDGNADFVGLDQGSTTFTCHNNTGSAFEVSGKSFSGFPEKYEHQYFFADFDADGLADLAQLNLRNGDIILHKTNPTATGGLVVDMLGFGRSVASAKFILPSEGRKVVQVDDHSVNTIMWYDIAYLPELTGWSGRGANGWFALNPNHPNTVPDDGLRYSTTTPTLGFYSSRDPEVIKQHAYWMRSMGIDTILVDFTNITSTKQTTSHVYDFTYALRNAFFELIDTYKGITEFVPPKIVVAIRLGEESVPFTISQEIADDMWELYQRCPEMWFTTHDGTSNHAKPVLIAFTKFSDPAWKTTGPAWTDSRFNMRFMNDNFETRTLSSYESTYWNRLNNDNWPYWTFLENQEVGSTGYYQNTYRRLPGTTISEYSQTWVSLYKGSRIWDGHSNLVDGKYLIERYTEPLQSKSPRVALVNRWNYPKGWYDEPQEGLSLSDATIIEPCVDLGFDIYDRSAEQVFQLRGLVEKAPGTPIIESVVGGRYVTYSSDNFPTQYKVSDDELGVEEEWYYVDINNPVIDLPAELRGGSFYLRTKNSFGESAASKYGRGSGLSFQLLW